MADLDKGGLWCPQCGDEYRPGFVQCADCGVPLADHPPPPPPVRDHGEVEYDLSAWSPDQRRALSSRLDAAGIAHGWERAHLVAPRAREPEVDELVDEIDEWDADEPADHDDAPPGLDGELARPARRVAGYGVDSVLLVILAIAVAAAFGERPPGLPLELRAGLLVAGGVYETVAVAMWGRTVGMVVAGTRLLDAGTGLLPGWWSAAIRWATASAFGIAEIAAGIDASPATDGISAAYLAAVYAGVFWDRRRQGLHDKLAGTIVVTA